MLCDRLKTLISLLPNSTARLPAATSVIRVAFLFCLCNVSVKYGSAPFVSRFFFYFFLLATCPAGCLTSLTPKSLVTTISALCYEGASWRQPQHGTVRITVHICTGNAGKQESNVTQFTLYSRQFRLECFCPSIVAPSFTPA